MTALRSAPCPLAAAEVRAALDTERANAASGQRAEAAARARAEAQARADADAANKGSNGHTNARLGMSRWSIGSTKVVPT